VQVVEYSCPTESSNIETEQRTTSEEESDSNEQLKFDPPPINHINWEVEQDINNLFFKNIQSDQISFNDNNLKSSMMQRIIEAKKHNQEINKNENLEEDGQIGELTGSPKSEKKEMTEFIQSKIEPRLTPTNRVLKTQGKTK